MASRIFLWYLWDEHRSGWSFGISCGNVCCCKCSHFKIACTAPLFSSVCIFICLAFWVLQLSSWHFGKIWKIVRSALFTSDVCRQCWIQWKIRPFHHRLFPPSKIIEILRCKICSGAVHKRTAYWEWFYACYHSPHQFIWFSSSNFPLNEFPYCVSNCNAIRRLSLFNLFHFKRQLGFPPLFALRSDKPYHISWVWVKILHLWSDHWHRTATRKLIVMWKIAWFLDFIMLDTTDTFNSHGQWHLANRCFLHYFMSFHINEFARSQPNLHWIVIFNLESSFLASNRLSSS